jgi:hypothetical protein
MIPLESPESSSPIVTRSIANGLMGRTSESYQFPTWQKIALDILGILPQSVARFTISHIESLTGLSYHVLDHFQINDLITMRLSDYAALSGPFPAIIAGSALSGATAYLSLALGGPFLPQAFVVSLKHGSMTGNVNEYLHRSMDVALRIADENPNLLTIQHYDPIHDGWMTRFINHLRFKLLDLPSAYAEFIKSRLEPGGAVVYLDSQASWLRYRIGPHSVFQVGGWGGISPEEFLQGSDRIRTYTRNAGMKYMDWKLNEFPVERGPESEWGSEPGLDQALEIFCGNEGYHFIRISLPHPNDFSRLAFAAAQRLLEKEGRQPAGVLVEMFSQFDAYSARESGLLPYWLIYNTIDSLENLKEMRSQFPKGKPVFFSPLATFSMTPDLVPWQDWEAALAGLDWVNIGTRPSHYPADTRALVKWVKPLREWVNLNQNPIKTRLDAFELLNLKQEILKA